MVILEASFRALVLTLFGFGIFLHWKIKDPERFVCRDYVYQYLSLEVNTEKLKKYIISLNDKPIMC